MWRVEVGSEAREAAGRGNQSQPCMNWLIEGIILLLKASEETDTGLGHKDPLEVPINQNQGGSWLLDPVWRGSYCVGPWAILSISGPWFPQVQNESIRLVCHF